MVKTFDGDEGLYHSLKEKLERAIQSYEGCVDANKTKSGNVALAHMHT